ncbi:MAG: selenide, water dikinase SelD [Cyanobium sp.]
MSAGLPEQRQLLLAGGGHTHALLLRIWLMRPRLRPRQCRITLVSRHGSAHYSGTLPALVAGLHPEGDGRIDLRRLCRLAEVVFVQAEITGLDPARQELQLAGRPALRFDRLSLDVGAVTASGLARRMGPTEQTGVPVKPLEPFLAWCAALPPGKEVRIRGGGAAGVELALALRARRHPVRLLLRDQGLRLGSAAANRAGEALLAAAGVVLERQAPEQAAADLLCTGSMAPPWLAACGLAVEGVSGRLLCESTLAVRGQERIFAAGDCGLIAAAPRPASGVWAVRAAPLLAANLLRSLEGKPLRAWRPQARALQLLGDGGACGDPQGQAPRALAFWGPVALGPSRLLWQWKKHLDSRFLRMFAELKPMAGALAGAGEGWQKRIGEGQRKGSGSTEQAMACRGCAAKLAAAPLQAALRRLAAGRDAAGGPPPVSEDAAVIQRNPDGSLLLQSVDGFPALVDDPFLNGRLTALHACSDLWACGAAVESAQALVTLPQGDARLQEELLLQSLAGVISVLEPLGAALVGGHTLEGRDGAGLGLALTVNGRAPAGRFWPKGPLRGGEVLLLSRPIGSGVLFAAAMEGAARPEWIDATLEVLQQSQAPLLELLAAHGCRACTDVTGFGLLGHLGEMLAGAAEGVRVQLEAGAIPALAGARELLQRGHASSLAPANASALVLLDGAVELVGAAAVPVDAREVDAALLIDPQTCGPLLAALPAAAAKGALAALQAAGFDDAAVIGRVAVAESARRTSPRASS